MTAPLMPKATAVWLIENTMLTFRHETLKEWQSHPFRFVCQERKGTLPEGVKA